MRFHKLVSLERQKFKFKGAVLDAICFLCILTASVAKECNSVAVTAV